MGSTDKSAGPPDFRITGFEPVSALTEDSYELVASAEEDLAVVAAHHSANGRDTYLVLYDATAIYGNPGAPAYVAVHVTRDLERRVFDFNHAHHPLLPLAQNWLIAKGCPPDAVRTPTDRGPQPADALTSRLEGLLRTNVGQRYLVLDHYTDHQSNSNAGARTSTLVHDRHPLSAAHPYRVFMEEVTQDFGTYTVREGAFSSIEAADLWIAAVDLPLPPAPTSVQGQRADAARIRTTCADAAVSAPTDATWTGERVGRTPAAPRRRSR
ncbi:hypothetical protein ABZZ17_25655 [Streptomyces sp. NPDC006512]|uniref:hypothetical protein n=1 Tax=Streptomyces sp. NPDC006512 TaxID=3154307 RepID=UPI0033A1BFCE